MSRFNLSEDGQTATFLTDAIEVVNLKAVAIDESTPGMCDGCYFLQDDSRCSDNVHRYSKGGTNCSTDRNIIWIEDKENEN